MECYCTCILFQIIYFFILQSLTTSKMIKFQTLKLSQFHKAKTCWTENWWSSEHFLRGVFYALGGKFFLIILKNILGSELKSCVKWSLKKCNFLFLKLNNMYFEIWIITVQTFLIQYSIPYTQVQAKKYNVSIQEYQVF